METGLNRAPYGSAECKLFLQTGVNDDVRVNRHTDTEDDTRNTGKRQCEVKCIDEHQHQRHVQDQRPGCQEARKQVENHHDDADKCKTDRTADERSADRFLSELRTDHVGADFMKSNLQTADTDIGRKLFCLVDAFHTFDDRLAVRDRGIDPGYGDKLSVIIDTDGLAVCIRFRSRIRKFAGALGCK